MYQQQIILDNVIKMTTAFHKTLRSALFLSKCIGLIDITYTMEPTTGLLVHNVNSLFHICFEITRFIVLLMFSYMYIFHRLPSIMLAIGVFNMLKFWICIIAARLSNNWIIDYFWILKLSDLFVSKLVMRVRRSCNLLLLWGESVTTEINLHPREHNLKILQVSKLLNSRVKIEKPRKTRQPPQYKSCQLYRHTL
ncbi:Uncharacterized protein FWK35_00033540, partial [Aphis craccivora]